MEAIILKLKQLESFDLAHELEQALHTYRTRRDAYVKLQMQSETLKQMQKNKSFNETHRVRIENLLARVKLHLAEEKIQLGVIDARLKALKAVAVLKIKEDREIHHMAALLEEHLPKTWKKLGEIPDVELNDAAWESLDVQGETKDNIAHISASDVQELHPTRVGDVSDQLLEDLSEEPIEDDDDDVDEQQHVDEDIDDGDIIGLSDDENDDFLHQLEQELYEGVHVPGQGLKRKGADDHDRRTRRRTEAVPSENSLRF